MGTRAVVAVLTALFGPLIENHLPATVSPSVAAAAPPPITIPKIPRSAKEIRISRHPESELVLPRVSERRTARSKSRSAHIKHDHKDAIGLLSRRGVIVRRELRGTAMAWEPFNDRQLARAFPNTVFLRLAATSLLDETEPAIMGLGAVCMGQHLVLPQDFTLLGILENRPLNAHNLRHMSELIVRMVDPEGPTSQKVLRYAVEGNAGGLPESATLETRSFNQRLKKRWTFVIREGRFYSLEERMVSYRAAILEGRPHELQEDEVAGIDEPKLVAFWRSPNERNAAARARAKWLTTHAVVSPPSEVPPE
jgi:hypothetical protein